MSRPAPRRGFPSTADASTRAGVTARAGAALLLAGHGSRSPAGAAECLALADRVRGLAPGLAVATGFIEACPPPISAAAGELAAAGSEEVVVVPLVLLDAGHAKTDVPASVNLARAEHPQVAFRYGRALGVDPRLLAVVDDRLAAAVAPAERADTAVLLVGRGSSDPAANAELHRAARLLWEGRAWPAVEPAFVGLTAPSVPSGLDRLARLGARRIVVAPFFLFTGVLERRIREQAAAFAEARPHLAVTVAGYLGPDERVAEVVLERFGEARDGPVPRSCDTCVHRVALPGFGDRLGAPLTPHAHPSDPRTGTADAHAHPPVTPSGPAGAQERPPEAPTARAGAQDRPPVAPSGPAGAHERPPEAPTGPAGARTSRHTHG